MTGMAAGARTSRWPGFAEQLRAAGAGLGPGASPVRLTRPDQALAWFTAEHPVLLAAAGPGAGAGAGR